MVVYLVSRVHEDDSGDGSIIGTYSSLNQAKESVGYGLRWLGNDQLCRTVVDTNGYAYQVRAVSVIE